MERLEIETKNKIGHAEVTAEISSKVRELVCQVKDALLTVEGDEADFKNAANDLHGLFMKLSESKADKSDLAQVSGYELP